MHAESKANSVREPCLRGMAGASAFLLLRATTNVARHFNSALARQLQVMPPVPFTPSVCEGSVVEKNLLLRVGDLLCRLFRADVAALVSERIADPSPKRAHTAPWLGMTWFESGGMKLNREAIEHPASALLSRAGREHSRRFAARRTPKNNSIFLRRDARNRFAHRVFSSASAPVAAPANSRNLRVSNREIQTNRNRRIPFIISNIYFSNRDKMRVSRCTISGATFTVLPPSSRPRKTPSRPRFLHTRVKRRSCNAIVVFVNPRVVSFASVKPKKGRHQTGE